MESAFLVKVIAGILPSESSKMNEADNQKAASFTEKQESTVLQGDCAKDQDEPAEVKIFNNIEKRTNDERNYRGVILKNELRVMLISDPEANLSAVSLNVGVGSYSNPPNLQGLAHYVEHMLFLGTEKVTTKICSNLLGIIFSSLASLIPPANLC